MSKRPTRTAVGSERVIPEREPNRQEAATHAGSGPALRDELRNSPPQHGLTFKDAVNELALRQPTSTLPAAPAEARSPALPDPEPKVRRSARALVPILADGTLYLPGTDSEMVPLTFEAYGELVAARLIEPVPWGSLDVAIDP